MLRRSEQICDAHSETSKAYRSKAGCRSRAPYRCRTQEFRIAPEDCGSRKLLPDDKTPPRRDDLTLHTPAKTRDRQPTCPHNLSKAQCRPPSACPAHKQFLSDWHPDPEAATQQKFRIVRDNPGPVERRIHCYVALDRAIFHCAHSSNPSPAAARVTTGRQRLRPCPSCQSMCLDSTVVEKTRSREASVPFPSRKMAGTGGGGHQCGLEQRDSLPRPIAQKPRPRAEPRSLRPLLSF